MTKSELIKCISQKMTTTHIDALHEKDIEKSVNQLIQKLIDVICAGTRIEIRGFGSFSLHYHPPRNAHNPKTGARLITEPKYSPHFKPGKELRERINANRHMPIIAAGEEAE
jgi:integration host factor subunit beta